MAKRSFAAMSVHALLKLKDDVTSALSKKAASMTKELAALGADYKEFGRIAVYGKKKGSLAGRKVAPKYRDPKTGETWSGRGATARWITAYEKSGKKRDQFLIAKSSKKAAKKAKRKKR